MNRKNSELKELFYANKLNVWHYKSGNCIAFLKDKSNDSSRAGREVYYGKSKKFNGIVGVRQ